MRALYKFNNKYFLVLEYKYRLERGEIDEGKYEAEKEKEFLLIYDELVKEHNI